MKTKKTVCMAILAAILFVVLTGACASSGATGTQSVYPSADDPIAGAVKKIYEGNQYAKQSNSEQALNSAIASYEEALGLQPSGTWKLPKKYPDSILIGGEKSRPIYASTTPPEGGIQARIENARQLLENLRQSKVRQEQEQQAILSRQVPDDAFQIKQNPDNTITITGFKMQDTRVLNLVIPETLYGLPVTEIGERAFSVDYLNSVVIPNTVTKIGKFAFARAEAYIRSSEYILERIASLKLRHVVIGNAVKDIGEGAFADNPDLTEIIIPASVDEIGSFAFMYCGLTSATLSSGLKEIRVDAFSNNKLGRITIPSTVSYIGDRAFSNNKLTSVTLPAGLKEIDERAFSSNQLTEITLPAGLELIRHSAFSSNQLIEITLPAGLQGISERVFAENKIQSLTILSNTTKFKDGRPDRLSGSSIKFNDKRPVFDGASITRITVPANLSDADLKNYGLEANFITFYKGQNRAAGTYEKNGPIWARSRAGGI